MPVPSHSGDRAVLHATRPVGAAAPTPLPARLAAAILPVVAASLLGGGVAQPKIPTSYAGLAKPAFTPPNAAFAPVWTLLFCLMAYALWRVLSRPAGPARARAVAAFFGQLALNVAWSFAFFGLESPGLALAVIAALPSAIPSMIGMRMSVRRRSKAPRHSSSRSRPSPPSLATVTSWPSISSPRLSRPRIGSSSSTRRMRAMSGASEEVGLAVEMVDDAHEGELAERVRHVHPVPDDEHVRAGEADEIRVDRDRALAGLLQHHRREDALRAAGHQQVLGEHHGAAGFEDVVDEQHVAAAHVALDVAQDRDLAGRHRALAIARQVDELHLGGEAGPVQGADEVRGEHEAALQDRDDEEVLRVQGRDGAREVLNSG